MMTCDTAWELLSQALDGEISPAEDTALQEHLHNCPTCRALQTELHGLHEALGELEVTPPPELKERILTALPTQRSSKTFYWKRWGAMAAALVLVALAAWRLPSFLYEGDRPQGETAATTADTTVPESDEVPALGVLSDEATPADEVLPDYVEGPGVDVNSYVPAFQAFDAPATLPTIYDVEATASTETADLGAEMPMAKHADQIELSRAKEVNTTAGAVAPISDYAAIGEGDGGAVVFPSVRMALAPDDEAVAVDNSYDTVPEVAPVTNDEMWVAAEALEPIAEEPDPFGPYCGVLTLEYGYEPQKLYPLLHMESGEVWYALPAEDFTSLVEEIDAQGLPYEFSLSGDNIDPDAPEGLVIVKPPYTP